MAAHFSVHYGNQIREAFGRHSVFPKTSQVFPMSHAIQQVLAEKLETDK